MAEIGFSEWTPYGRLRHPRFLGLRDDKAPTEVVREAMTTRRCESAAAACASPTPIGWCSRKPV